MKDVEIIKFIKTELKCIGDGKKDNPHRRIIQYWTLEGDLIFEIDRLTNRVEYCKPR